MNYLELPHTYQEQVGLLQTSGLGISDKNHAIALLKQIGYYRLNTYGLPFQSKQDRYNGQTQIEDIERLHNFDRDLRNIYLATVSRIEIPLRTRIAYFLARQYGPFGYLLETNFSKYFNHSQWLSHVQIELDRSKEIFIQNFKHEYQKQSHGLPLWMLVEVMSFGSLSLLFSGLKNDDQAEIAMEFSIHCKVLRSWLHCLVYTRNICAHHARFWNRILAIRPLIPKKTEEWQSPFPIDNSKVFSIFTITNYLLKEISPDYDLKSKLLELFAHYPSINSSKMGFVTGWHLHELWK